MPLYGEEVTTKRTIKGFMRSMKVEAGRFHFWVNVWFFLIMPRNYHLPNRATLKPKTHPYVHDDTHMLNTSLTLWETRFLTIGYLPLDMAEIYKYKLKKYCYCRS